MDFPEQCHPRRADLPGANRRHLLAACVGLALLGAGCAPPAFADGRLVQVDIVDRDTGQPLHVYRDHGRPVVAGRPGARYAVQVVNRSGERVMVVVAIDGVNIMTGETAAVDQDGYVLEPYQTASLTGWRKSHSEVAAFEFTNLANSYAARTGRPDDVGVIGVATFREKPAVVGAWRASRGRDDSAPPPAPLDRRADGSATPPPPSSPAPDVASRANASRADAAAGALNAAPELAKAAPRSQAQPGGAPPAQGADAVADKRVMHAPPEPTERLGTGHGPREESWVVDTTFDRLSARPQEVVRIRYDSLPNLVAAGIAPRVVAQVPSWRDDAGPRAFPGNEPGFVPDPPAR